MTLEIITTLRSLNEDKLAEQLENIVRDYYYINTQEGGSLVSIKPPELPLEEDISDPILNASPGGPKLQTRPNLPKIETHIEIRGTLSGSSEEQEYDESSTQVRSTTPQGPSVLQSGTPSQGSTQIKGSYSSGSSPSSPVKKRTIELMGSDY